MAPFYVKPLVLMLTGGGRSLEDLRTLKSDTDKAFRLIVVRYKRQAELFDDQPRYHVIASNRVESTADTLVWYRQRGEVSENGIKDGYSGRATQWCAVRPITHAMPRCWW